MLSPVMMFFSLLPSPVALDPSLQPHAAVSLNRAAAFNASCDCIDLRAARSADGPGGGYALLARSPLSGLNASFDLSFEVFFQNPTFRTGVGLLLFDASDHDKESGPYPTGTDNLGSYRYKWRWHMPLGQTSWWGLPRYSSGGGVCGVGLFASGN